ncbi:hypothetical protein CWI75_02455 [Kineobactrum sediminis]|uniref:Double zinc ribbon domain-containing protein n=1 Tax=Kineobactrum sediminis TaxID=1905677 RepID=A0A2N5Y761_9GAMM|nr:ComF family protein [Kineobactrum sediminis]PLW84224.1 hypothetical protein CWI75_02455 [Kineobactrum sediminis]
MVNTQAHQLLESVFPQYCVLCQLRSHDPLPLCVDCSRQFQLNEHCCRRCALPLAWEPGNSGEAPLCGPCQSQPPPFDRVVAPLIYEDHIAHLIQRWKFQRQRRLTPLLASLWLGHAVLAQPLDRDLLLPVPLHWRRQLWRGFNQAALLGHALQKQAPNLAATPLRANGLRRIRATPAQAGLNARERSRNLTAAFGIRCDARGLRVALIDDVMTTGTTAAALATVLKQAGAKDVQLWCLARTPAPGH